MVLVPTVLVGLLGMHALGPGGVARHVRPAHAVAFTAPDDCHGGDGHCGGRLHHADPTCASGAVTGAPQMPAPAPDPATAPAENPCPSSRAATGADGARAPPSLAELQLLLI